MARTLRSGGLDCSWLKDLCSQQPPGAKRTRSSNQPVGCLEKSGNPPGHDIERGNSPGNFYHAVIRRVLFIEMFHTDHPLSRTRRADADNAPDERLGLWVAFAASGEESSMEEVGTVVTRYLMTLLGIDGLGGDL